MKDIKEIFDDILFDIEHNGLKTCSRYCKNSIMVARQHSSFLSAIAFFATLNAKGDIVEVGIDSGIGALSMGWGVQARKNIKVYSVDIRECCVTSSIARAKKLGITNVEFFLGTSSDLKKKTNEVAVAFIDGGHKYQDCLKDLMQVSRLMNVMGTIICHDCSIRVNGNDGVRKAVAEFCRQVPGWHVIRINGYAILNRGVVLCDQS